ncbi:MAG: M23 family metallopeptidase [Patescibacteria group bacterium]
MRKNLLRAFLLIGFFSFGPLVHAALVEITDYTVSMDGQTLYYSQSLGGTYSYINGYSHPIGPVGSFGTSTQGYCDFPYTDPHCVQKAFLGSPGGSSPVADGMYDIYICPPGEGTCPGGNAPGSFSDYAYVIKNIVVSGNQIQPTASPADYSLPIDPSDFSTTTSLFDHDSVSSQMTRYDGTIFYGNDADINYCIDAQGCYDGHHGIDFGTNAEGKDILAAASGTVETLGWENPSNHNQGYGYRMRIYHPEFDQSTIYAHATTTASFFSVNDTVNRGDTILLSGMTGASSGPHLHFGVILGDTGDPSQSIDPFGWGATSTDPRTNDKGYLWRTNPPSL